MNRFLVKQAGIYSNTDLTDMEEHEVPGITTSALGGGFAGGSMGLVAGELSQRDVNMGKLREKLNMYGESDGLIGNEQNFRRAYDLENAKILRNKRGIIGAGATAGAAGFGYLAHEMNKEYNQQMTAKEAFAQSQEEMEKIALSFRKKKEPNEFDKLIAERESAINAYKENVSRLDKLNPQARADANAAMGAARKAQEGPRASQNNSTADNVKANSPKPSGLPERIPAAAQGATQAKPKLGKGRIALLAGGTALAAGGAKMGYDKWKEEKVAFSDIAEDMLKIARHFS